MSIDVFSIQCDALDGAKLAGFKGTEALNRPFEIDLFFTVPLGTDVKGAIGARATLTADRDDGRGPMCWHGILASLRLLHETAERALYRAVLVPKLWLLRRHIRSFVHTKKKIDAFTADTLKDGGLASSDFTLHANAGAFPLEEFVCQYRESHLDFVHRWFEREGLYYYFEHPEGAGASERMIVVDDKAGHHPLFGEGHVRYFPAAGHDGSAGECFRELSADFELLPESVLISDYNYANPAAPVAGEKAVSQVGQGKIREYGYRVFTEGEAKRLAQIKAQSMACRELVLTATGTYLGLRAGYTFELEEGPSDLPTKYLAIELRHAGAVSGASPMVRRYTGLDANETYRVHVVAIPSNVQYRAPQSTAWPRIYGFENGTVDGPGESQYAQIDDQGRYLVRFKFDVGDLPDGSTSTYLRMMQPHGGTTEGLHFPLRKGTEVMVSFQGGDPDRPVTPGVVPNAVQPSNVTARNHTQNVLRTGGGNQIVMDDIDGAQFVDITTPTDGTQVWIGGPKLASFKIPDSGYKEGDPGSKGVNCSLYAYSQGDAGFMIEGNWWQNVGKNYLVDIVGNAAIHYKGTYSLRVDAAADENYVSERTTTIIGAYKQNAWGGMTHDIKGGLTQVIAPDGSQTVKGDWTHKVAATAHDEYGNWKTDVTGSWTANVGAAVMLTAGGMVKIKSPTIILQAPVVRIEGAAIQAKSPEFFETYGSKRLIGAHKADYVYAHYQCGYTTKVETTGISLGGFGNKSDRVASKTDLIGVAMKIAGTLLRKAGITSNTAGLHEFK